MSRSGLPIVNLNPWLAAVQGAGQVFHEFDYDGYDSSNDSTCSESSSSDDDDDDDDDEIEIYWMHNASVNGSIRQECLQICQEAADDGQLSDYDMVEIRGGVHRSRSDSLDHVTVRLRTNSQARRNVHVAAHIRVTWYNVAIRNRHWEGPLYHTAVVYNNGGQELDDNRVARRRGQRGGRRGGRRGGY